MNIKDFICPPFLPRDQAVAYCAGRTLSSTLILDAESIALSRWPNSRLYTYVNPNAIKSTNPGCCFLKAGWRHCGITKWNKLLILEKLPPTINATQVARLPNPPNPLHRPPTHQNAL